MRRAALAFAALLASGRFAPAQSAPAEGEAAPGGFRAAAALAPEALQSLGINPAFIVAVRLADDGRILIAEHRPSQGSMLHVLKADGEAGFQLPVRSPQLADFTVDADGRVLLVGNLGTRFYSADLEERKSSLILSSLPDRPGFRALPPVSILRSPDGPVVYGLFYDSQDSSRGTGFARIGEGGAVANILSTTDWGTRFGPALSFIPDPKVESALLVAEQAKGAGGKAATARLLLVDRAGKSREIDAADEIFGAAWSPTGSSFAYVRRHGERQELVAASAGNVAPFVVAEGRYFGPVFAGRGRTLVVAAKEPKGMSVWAMRFPSGQLERLELPDGPCVYVTSPSGGRLAAWGPWGVRAFVGAPG